MANWKLICAAVLTVCACAEDSKPADEAGGAGAPDGMEPGGAVSGSPAKGTGGKTGTTDSPPAVTGGAPGMPPTMPGDGSKDGGASLPPASAALTGMCPDGFTPAEGLNKTFPHEGGVRHFNVTIPTTGDGPRPLFVALTGTVQEELAFATQSGLAELPSSGWIVVSPIRSCTQESRTCNTVGSDGRVWEPWFDGTMPRTDEAGPDVAFIDAMVRCVASKWPVAADKIYAGGISAGGSMTNRTLTFNSKLFAGGVAASGNWAYGVPPATPMKMDSSIAIIVWGGPTDTWPGSPPYAAETKAAAEFYAAQPNVVTVSCSGTHGHSWPAAMTPWLADTLLSHPKGTDPASFVLKQPPNGFTCVVGAYTDH